MTMSGMETRKRFPLRALPAGINLRDFYWKPTPDEKAVDSKFLERQRRNRLAKLQRLEKAWLAEDVERLKRRAAELELVAVQDRIYVARVTAIEQEQKRVTDYWLHEQEKQAAAERKALLERLERATKAINADTVQAERKVLAARGVLRGRRKWYSAE